LFGLFAGMNYWFPKAFGFTLNERLGRWSFWFWITGFYVAFMPLYIPGFLGMTRRLGHYDVLAWQPYLVVALGGAILIMIGICLQVAQLFVSIRDRADHRDLSGDPWNGRTLEWSLPSPPPFYNFAVIPKVDALDAFWVFKTAQSPDEPITYTDIEMPKSTPAGLLIGVLGGVLAFALIWHIWWAVIVAFVGILAVVVWRAYQSETDYIVTAAEIAAIETSNKRQPEMVIKA